MTLRVTPGLAAAVDTLAADMGLTRNAALSMLVNHGVHQSRSALVMSAINAGNRTENVMDAPADRGPAPAGSAWTPPVDREAQLAARCDALAVEHQRVKQDRPETRPADLPPSLRPSPPVPNRGDTTWSQATKRPKDAARTAELAAEVARSRS